MRRAIHQWLTTSPALIAVVPSERFIARSALPDNMKKPFIAVSLPGETVPRFSRTSWEQFVDVYVYDEPGSYVFIDDTLDLVSDRMVAVQHFLYDGFRMTMAEEISRSDDLQDDVLPANMKSVSFRVVGGRTA